MRLLRLRLRKGFLTAQFFLALTLLASAEEVTNIPEIGAHYRILTVEKNVHPENRMVLFTRVDAKGRVVTDPANQNQPVFDFYWLMDGKDYKPVNPIIKAEIRKRFESQWDPGEPPNRFTVKMNDLKEVNCDIKELKMEVYVRKNDGRWSVEAEMMLGPSDGQKRIRLSSIYTEGRAFPPAVHSVTLKGQEVVAGRVAGELIIRKYDSQK